VIFHSYVSLPEGIDASSFSFGLTTLKIFGFFWILGRFLGDLTGSVDLTIMGLSKLTTGDDQSRKMSIFPPGISIWDGLWKIDENWNSTFCWTCMDVSPKLGAPKLWNS